jgi:DNA-binding CsgD family transcriptional regulator
MASGFTSQEIAQRLVLSPQTVETHARNLKRKLGARTRVHALAIALKHRETTIGL